MVSFAACGGDPMRPSVLVTDANGALPDIKIPTDDTAVVSDVRADSESTDVTSSTSTVCGMSVPREGSWRAEGSRVYLGDRQFPVWGLNWFGLETNDRAPHGLWARPIEQLVDQVLMLGFTALRVPVSPGSIRPGNASASWANRGSIDTGREQLEALLELCRARGLRVLLDFHTCDSSRIGGSLPGSPIACSGYSRETWLSDLRELAALAEQYHPVVMGIDLCNEPHALTWSQWRDLATVGGEAVLCRNPRVLVFVEGVGNMSNNAGNSVFWGENLTEAGAMPVGLPRDRLVYSPHVYGPSVSRMPYFSVSDFPRNMPAIWDAHFGHLQRRGDNVLIGEFCGWYDDARAANDVAWQDGIVDWMRTRELRGYFYWALNPNSSDTGGILLDDWRTPNTRKLMLLQRLMR
jgi:endoglucanase